jgi:hypothetical protein
VSTPPFIQKTRARILELENEKPVTFTQALNIPQELCALDVVPLTRLPTPLNLLLLCLIELALPRLARLQQHTIKAVAVRRELFARGGVLGFKLVHFAFKPLNLGMCVFAL